MKTKNNYCRLILTAALALCAFIVSPPPAAGQTITTQTNNIVFVATNSATGHTITYTNPEVITIVDWPPTVAVAGDTNAPGIQQGINEIINAVTGNATNWYGVLYGLYSPALGDKYGFGLGAFYPVSQYVIGGVRLDYVNGGFWMPNGTVTFQVPIRPLTFLGGYWTNVVMSPFLYAGLGIPLSGAQIVTQVGNVTVPGSIKNNNGQPTAITGEGVVVSLWHRDTPTKIWYQPTSLGAAFDIEQWSGFPGSQYRLGVEAHWQLK